MDFGKRLSSFNLERNEKVLLQLRNYILHTQHIQLARIDIPHLKFTKVINYAASSTVEEVMQLAVRKYEAEPRDEEPIDLSDYGLYLPLGQKPAGGPFGLWLRLGRTLASYQLSILSSPNNLVLLRPDELALQPVRNKSSDPNLLLWADLLASADASPKKVPFLVLL